MSESKTFRNQFEPGQFEELILAIGGVCRVMQGRFLCAMPGDWINQPKDQIWWETNSGLGSVKGFQHVGLVPDDGLKGEFFHLYYCVINRDESGYIAFFPEKFLAYSTFSFANRS